MKILGMDYRDILQMLESEHSKGAFHSKGLMQHIYQSGTLEGLDQQEAFLANPNLARSLQKDWSFSYPDAGKHLQQEETHKFSLVLQDEQEIESVYIPMETHGTLCISSQVGCKRACAFCRTARLGLKRNLRAAEIVAQYMYSRFILQKNPRNLVFMGMGEPLDNLQEVLKAIEILTSPYGAALLHKHISLSTCGQVEGLHRLADIIASEPGRMLHLLTLALSLNAAEDSLRDRLMPVNRKWPLKTLKEALLSLPQSGAKDKLYLEYILIPGVNDRPGDADSISRFMEGMTAKVNLIPLNAPEGSEFKSAENEDLLRFWTYLREREITCFSRKRKGDAILASCGQLAGSSTRETL